MQPVSEGLKFHLGFTSNSCVEYEAYYFATLNFHFPSCKTENRKPNYSIMVKFKQTRKKKT